MANYAQNNIIIDALHDPALVLPGQTSTGDLVSITEKYEVATGAFLFPGLVAVRRGNAALEAQDYGQLTTPVEEDIIGVVALPYRAENTVSSYVYEEITALPVGSKLRICNFTTGFIYCYAGEDISADGEPHVTATTTGTGATRVLAGSIVSSSFAAGPTVAAPQFNFNPQKNDFIYAKGSLIPIAITGTDR